MCDPLYFLLHVCCCAGGSQRGRTAVCDYTVEEKEEWGEMSVLLFGAWLFHSSQHEHCAAGQRVNIGWLCENCTASTYSQRWRKKDGWGQPFYERMGEDEHEHMHTSQLDNSLLCGCRESHQQVMHLNEKCNLVICPECLQRVHDQILTKHAANYVLCIPLHSMCLVVTRCPVMLKDDFRSSQPKTYFPMFRCQRGSSKRTLTLK